MLLRKQLTSTAKKRLMFACIGRFSTYDWEKKTATHVNMPASSASLLHNVTQLSSRCLKIRMLQSSAWCFIHCPPWWCTTDVLILQQLRKSSFYHWPFSAVVDSSHNTKAISDGCQPEKHCTAIHFGLRLIEPSANEATSCSVHSITNTASTWQTGDWWRKPRDSENEMLLRHCLRT